MLTIDSTVLASWEQLASYISSLERLDGLEDIKLCPCLMGEEIQEISAFTHAGRALGTFALLFEIIYVFCRPFIIHLI